MKFEDILKLKLDTVLYESGRPETAYKLMEIVSKNEIVVLDLIKDEYISIVLNKNETKKKYLTFDGKAIYEKCNELFVK